MRLSPAYAFFQFTSWCNSKCVTCHLWQHEHETIPVEVMDRLGLFLDPVNTRSIFLTGGEPLLPPTCVEIAKSVDRWKPGIPMVSATNGLCPDLYVSHAKAMRDAGVQIRFAVSLNGRKETHDASRGVPGNYEKAVETATRLNEIGALRSINILAIPGMTTGADWSHAMEIARNLGVPCWSSPVLRHNPWFGEEDDGATIPLFDCHGGGEALVVLHNGDITACQETRPELVFGNLRDEELDAGKVAQIQAHIRARGCQPCGCCTNAFTEGMFVS